MRIAIAVAASVLAVAVAIPTSARASGADVIKDCRRHGRITHHYSQREYRQALAELPADVDEYGDCGRIIREAQLSGATRDGDRRDGDGPGGRVDASGALTGSPAPPTTSGASPRAGADGALPDRGPADVDPADPAAWNPATSDENQALLDASRNGSGPVRVGRDAITPGANASFARLPTPLMVVVALLGGVALAGATAASVARLRARRRARRRDT
jgi:hypothetical protein